MKKVIAICTALLLTVVITGCGNSAEENSLSAPTNSSSENSTSQEQETTATKAVVDPFENVKYAIPEQHEGTQKLNIYPDNFELKFDLSETPFYGKIGFNYEIESANAEKLIIKLTANIDNISDFLAETAYTVENTETIYEFDVSDLPVINLLNPEQLTEDNKKLLVEAMSNKITSYFRNGVDDYFDDEWDFEETEETEENQNLEFTINKLYLSFFEAGTQFSAKARDSKVEVSHDKSKNAGAVFIGNDGNYYAVETRNLIFKDGKLDIENLEIIVRRYNMMHSGGQGLADTFPDENSAFLGATSFARDIEGINLEEGYIIEEIPLD